MRIWSHNGQEYIVVEMTRINRKKIIKASDGYWMPIKSGWIYLGKKRPRKKRNMKYEQASDHSREL